MVMATMALHLDLDLRAGRWRRKRLRKSALRDLRTVATLDASRGTARIRSVRPRLLWKSFGRLDETARLPQRRRLALAADGIVVLVVSSSWSWRFWRLHQEIGTSADVILLGRRELGRRKLRGRLNELLQLLYVEGRRRAEDGAAENCVVIAEQTLENAVEIRPPLLALRFAEKSRTK
jgi:hypothetical protein